ncbi:MAG: ABC transporter permease [Clostridium sp.]
MNSFRYAINEILKTYIVTIILIIQLGFCTVMVYKAVVLSDYYREIINGINYIESGRDIHALTLGNGEAVYMQRRCKNTDKVINYMKSQRGFKLAPITIVDSYIKDFKGGKTFESTEIRVNNKGNDRYLRSNSLAIGEGFFDAFNIRLSQGYLNDFYNYNNKQIPVILGDKYKKFYSIGSIIEGKSVVNEQYKVVGFLDKGQYFTLNGNNFHGSSIRNMDTFFLRPMLKDDQDKHISSYVFTFDKGSTDKDRVFNLIKEQGKKYDIQIDFANNIDEMKDYNKVIMTNININRLLLIITLSFVIVGTLVVFINKIDLRKKEFGVHILCGARLKDIGLTVFFEIIIISIMSLTLAFWYLIYSNTKIDDKVVDFSWMDFTITSLIVLCFMSLLALIPIRKLLKININTLVRGEE